MIKEQQLFSYIDAYISGTTDPGLFIVDGRLMEGVTIEPRCCHLEGASIDGH